MKKIVALLILACIYNTCFSQAVFKTVVTQAPVVLGESFQVQYILEDIDNSNEFFPPDFKDFRFVSGPYVYKVTGYGKAGTGQLKNIVYTLEAIKPGVFRIPEATAKVNGHYIKSDKAFVEIITVDEADKRNLGRNTNVPASNSPFHLLPGEDPYKQIGKNLFIKVIVDKKVCFIGEPVKATFKLYSRLESVSDIIKNPGFYGFTVQDIIGLEDKILTSEIINGKKFDVHTVRQVQLYPLQAGSFVIDPMEVKNKVHFAKSTVYKKAEQEIVEGILPGKNSFSREDPDVYETSMSTNAVGVTVKSFPEKNRPADFNNATGNFSIEALPEKNNLAKNEEGKVKLTISGKGNFTQITAPVINWPEGIDGFDPQINDDLDAKKIPLAGKRTFSYSFVSAKPGDYSIPAISFSFFDPDTNSYKTVSSKPVEVTVSSEEGLPAKQPGSVKASPDKNYVTIGLLFLVVILVAAGGWMAWTNRKKENPVQVLPEKNSLVLSITEILNPADSLLTENNKIFYSALYSCIWNFFTDRFKLSGSSMSHQNLMTIMKRRNIGNKTRETIMQILEECETGIFTDAQTYVDKEALLKKTKKTLEQIQNYC